MSVSMKSFLFFLIVSFCSVASLNAADPTLAPSELRCEYLVNPLGMDTTKPRLSWRVESNERGQKQSAYHLLVASSPELLAKNEGDLWDTGKVSSSQTLHLVYQGQPLRSRQFGYWKVMVWDARGTASSWSESAHFSMGLLDTSEWTADYISYRDETPIHKDVETLFLPAARQYRKSFTATKKVERAMVYSTALGIHELEINGQRVGDAYFAPGWTDYRQRAYYTTHDVTDLVRDGDNAIGAWVADGWYSGYVGFGLLTGMGTEKNGRSIYGKTPSFLSQLELHYSDGTRETISTDKTWKVSGDGPIQEADLLMGEAYDARKELQGWSTVGFNDSGWDNAILASENGNPKAMFYEWHNPQGDEKGTQFGGSERELGFVRPKLEAFPGVPVRITEEVPAVKVTAREQGTYVFDLGQNIAGVARLKVKGRAGHRIQIRYGEMLHPDGRLMTENLRKARATDFYTCKGDSDGEVFIPRFTFHGFQFVEVSNFPAEPTTDAVTGLVMHSDTPMTSNFECSDPMVNQLFSNVLWTQRANFLDLPTDCPQRDERMGWTGDAQAYVGTAAYNADIGAFYTKWLRELMESQRPSGAFPGYAPFPFQHGWDFGTAWSDAGVICPWTIWQAYGDTQVIETCWEPMTRYMQWRKETSKGDLGIVHGNAWGDWLAQGASTPLDYVDSIYLAISARMMAEMADATNRSEEAETYRQQFARTKAAFQKKYLSPDGSLNVATQSAQALALFADLIPEDQREATGEHLAQMIAENGNHMSTGFLGTRPLLPVLSASGQHDLAVFLLQSREFPSWGYEIENGATTIWERWDSYTKEDAFGRHNAAMNSFSHYAFGAVCEWMFNTLAGIRSDGPGYEKIVIQPKPPAPGSNGIHEPIDWVKASYESIRGTIRSEWKLDGNRFELNVTIPTNTTAMVFLPANSDGEITEGGKPLVDHPFAKLLGTKDGIVQIAIQSGDYQFASTGGIPKASVALRTSKPKDMSLNPEGIDLRGSKQLVKWDFKNDADVAKWHERNNVEVVKRDGNVYLVATGNDPQIIANLDKSLTGRLVIELKALPKKGVTSQFFWADAKAGFNAERQNKRPLSATEQINSYLFSIGDEQTIGKLRFDPFDSFDPYADKGELLIESIAIHQLAEPEKVSAKVGRPNVMFILSEDQGAHTSFVGTPGLRTPHIDAIARAGTYFQNAFVPYPVCSASKAAIYTSLHNHVNGILNNTYNFHKPASEVTDAERTMPLSKNNFIRKPWFTLTEILHNNGYYQGVTHKLHVLPNEKFPYDEFIRGGRAELTRFIQNAKAKEQPWFLLVNLPNSHRPYPNSDTKPIRVRPEEVSLPSYLPDTAVVRKDWAEYLAGIEEVDALTGQAMEVLRDSGEANYTIVIFMSDHGPTFQHGKMTMYDLGLRVPLIFSGPGIQEGARSTALASGLDLMPTILDLVNQQSRTPLSLPKPSERAVDSFPYPLHGVSLLDILKDEENATGHDFIFAQISNLGPLPNDGIQERSVFDGRWKLIYRENVEKRWRQVNADSRLFKTWGNRTYDETIRVKEKFPEQFRILAEMDPQELNGTVPELELYDLSNDPDEMENLVSNAKRASEKERLMTALRNWAERTNDKALHL